MTTSGQSAGGRRYAAIVGKSVGELTAEDFTYLRREYPALAETRSREYDAWWASRGTPAAPTVASTAKPSLFTATEKAAFRTVLKGIAAHADTDPLTEVEKMLGECRELSPTPAFASRVIALYLVTLVTKGREQREQLEARIAALESRPPMTYREVWNAGVKYVPGDVVTDHGSLWYCKAESQGRRPGGESSATYWRMAVRKGSDGRNCPNCAKGD